MYPPELCGTKKLIIMKTLNPVKKTGLLLLLASYLIMSQSFTAGEIKKKPAGPFPADIRFVGEDE